MSLGGGGIYRQDARLWSLFYKRMESDFGVLPREMETSEIGSKKRALGRGIKRGEMGDI